MPIVTVETLEGTMTTQQKQKIVDVTSKALGDMGISPERTNIILKDNSWRNWAVAGVFQSEFADHIPPLH